MSVVMDVFTLICVSADVMRVPASCAAGKSYDECTGEKVLHACKALAR
jgi:hypothetical protein